MAVMWEVIEHLPRDTEEHAFQEIKRVLRNSGGLYLSTPHRTFFSRVLDPAWWLMRHRHYSLHEIEKISKKTGFKIEKVEHGGGYWELFSMILLYIFKWCFKTEIPLKRWFERKRDEEFLNKHGWTNIFLMLRSQ